MENKDLPHGRSKAATSIHRSRFLRRRYLIQQMISNSANDTLSVSRSTTSTVATIGWATIPRNSTSYIAGTITLETVIRVLMVFITVLLQRRLQAQWQSLRADIIAYRRSDFNRPFSI